MAHATRRTVAVYDHVHDCEEYCCGLAKNQQESTRNQQEIIINFGHFHGQIKIGESKEQEHIF